MSNTSKNTPTPKTAAEQAKASNEVTDAVIAGATTEEVAAKVKKTIPSQSVNDDQLDKVLNNAGETLFTGTPDEVRAWLNTQPSMIYAVRQSKKNGLVVSTEYVEETPLKLTLIQRAKAAAEKLKQNKKALVILGGALVVAGLTIKNNRKTTAEPEVEETAETTEIPNPDDTTDSI